MSLIQGLSLAMLAWCTLSAFAAESDQSLLAVAVELNNRGNAAAAISILEPMVKTSPGGLDDVQRGMAWNILGSAHQGIGEYEIAQHCYESAIHLLRADSSAEEIYVAAVDNLASLEVLMSQLDAATVLRLRARKVYERRLDYAGLTRTDSNLAVIALSRNNVRRVHDYLNDAFKDAQQASNLSAADRAAMYAVQGNIAAHDRDFVEAVKAYQRSIDLWMNVQGRESSVVAWEHALRGDAYRELGDLPEANKELRMALGLLEEANA
jgi:tetratricopeptide (TPR) repeat protein